MTKSLQELLPNQVEPLDIQIGDTLYEKCWIRSIQYEKVEGEPLNLNAHLEIIAASKETKE